jgi:hypothetical protein
MGIAIDGEHHQPHGDDAIDTAKSEHRQADTGARFGGTVGVLAVQQRADQTLLPRLRRSLASLIRRRLCGHC